MFSAQYGWWNERLKSDYTFITALKHLCKANVLAMHAILEVQPNASFIQSESSEYFHAIEPEALPLARFLNQKRFLSLDLTYGYPIQVAMYEYLQKNGMTKKEYQWFVENQVKARCIMGNDYYVTNEHIVHPDGSTSDVSVQLRVPVTPTQGALGISRFTIKPYGTITYTVQPESDFPVKNGYAVQFYVKAYRKGDPSLAGISGTRLVQVATAKP